MKHAIDLTREEKIAIFTQFTKRELAEMLMNAVDLATKGRTGFRKIGSKHRPGAILG